MKKIYLLLIAAILIIAYACEKELLFENTDFEILKNEENSKIGRDGDYVTVPFKLVGYTEIDLAGSGPSEECSDLEFCFLNLQNGKAEASHFGEDVDLSFRFCVKFPEAAGGCSGVEPYGPIEYNNATGKIIADNGDEIYLKIRGTGYLYPTERPGYNLEFHDTFDFDGGTGRFEGAKGYFITNSYNKGLITDHEFKGFISYKKK